MSALYNSKLNSSEKILHERALVLARQHRQLEWQIIKTLQELDRRKIFKRLGATSLFNYAVQILGLSESVAQAFIVVARKATQIKQLADVIEQQKLSVNKASRLTSVMTNDNAADLLQFAQTHTSRQIEFEVARINPKAAAKNTVKPISGGLVEVRVTVSKNVYEKWLRIQNLMAQKTAKHAKECDALEGAFEAYLDRHDPVRKAERACNKNRALDNPEVSQAQHRTCKTPSPPPPREPLSAEQKHQVFARDQGRCTHVDSQGRRCESERWIEIHHIKPVSRGGTNDPENLTTLCSAHHDLAHQYALPLEGQVTWLRSPAVAYG